MTHYLLQNLPKEIILNIFSYLTVEELYNLVCFPLDKQQQKLTELSLLQPETSEAHFYQFKLIKKLSYRFLHEYDKEYQKELIKPLYKLLQTPQFLFWERLAILVTLGRMMMPVERLFDSSITQELPRKFSGCMSSHSLLAFFKHLMPLMNKEQRNSSLKIFLSGAKFFTHIEQNNYFAKISQYFTKEHLESVTNLLLTNTYYPIADNTLDIFESHLSKSEIQALSLNFFIKIERFHHSNLTFIATRAYEYSLLAPYLDEQKIEYVIKETFHSIKDKTTFPIKMIKQYLIFFASYISNHKLNTLLEEITPLLFDKPIAVNAILSFSKRLFPRLNKNYLSQLAFLLNKKISLTLEKISHSEENILKGELASLKNSRKFLTIEESESFFDFLLKALNDQRPGVCIEAIELLNKVYLFLNTIQKKLFINALLEKIIDKDDHEQVRAASRTVVIKRASFLSQDNLTFLTINLIKQLDYNNETLGYNASFLLSSLLPFVNNNLGRSLVEHLREGLFSTSTGKIDYFLVLLKKLSPQMKQFEANELCKFIASLVINDNFLFHKEALECLDELVLHLSPKEYENLILFFMTNGNHEKGTAEIAYCLIAPKLTTLSDAMLFQLAILFSRSLPQRYKESLSDLEDKIRQNLYSLKNEQLNYVMQFLKNKLMTSNDLTILRLNKLVHIFNHLKSNNNPLHLAWGNTIASLFIERIKEPSFAIQSYALSELMRFGTYLKPNELSLLVKDLTLKLGDQNIYDHRLVNCLRQLIPYLPKEESPILLPLAHCLINKTSSLKNYFADFSKCLAIVLSYLDKKSAQGLINGMITRFPNEADEVQLNWINLFALFHDYRDNNQTLSMISILQAKLPNLQTFLNLPAELARLISALDQTQFNHLKPYKAFYKSLESTNMSCGYFLKLFIRLTSKIQQAFAQEKSRDLLRPCSKNPNALFKPSQISKELTFNPSPILARNSL